MRRPNDQARARFIIAHLRRYEVFRRIRNLNGEPPPVHEFVAEFVGLVFDAGLELEEFRRPADTSPLAYKCSDGTIGNQSFRIELLPSRYGDDRIVIHVSRHHGRPHPDRGVVDYRVRDGRLIRVLDGRSTNAEPVNLASFRKAIAAALQKVKEKRRTITPPS